MSFNCLTGVFALHVLWGNHISWIYTREYVYFCWMLLSFCTHSMGLLPDTLRMHRECRTHFPYHRLERKLLVSDPGMHHRYLTRSPWAEVGRHLAIKTVIIGSLGRKELFNAILRTQNYIFQYIAFHLNIPYCSHIQLIYIYSMPLCHVKHSVQ